MSANANSQTRKRGRPSGKNRVPLTAEERRARNAYYERERREEMAAALADLADAAGCSNNVSNEKLLKVVSKILKKTKTNKKHRTTDILIAQNKAIMDEISKLEEESQILDIAEWLRQEEPESIG